MLALCREHRLEHRTKHIALRYFLARELQQRGQLRLAYVASEANTADIFTKALAPGDHQRFCTLLGFLLVGNFMHFMATFVAAFIIGFTMLWQLTLIILAIVPLMAGCGAVYAIAITGVTSKGQHTYAQTGVVAEQAMGQAQLQSRPWGNLSRTARRRAARCSPPCSPLSSSACECSSAACECQCPSATGRSGPAALCRGYVLAGPVACISSARQSLADASDCQVLTAIPSSVSTSSRLSRSVITGFSSLALHSPPTALIPLPLPLSLPPLHSFSPSLCLPFPPSAACERPSPTGPALCKADVIYPPSSLPPSPPLSLPPSPL
ncbi:unnamed protein product [Closterium sp. NIES-54]